jgi:hypothetical protein
MNKPTRAYGACIMAWAIPRMSRFSVAETLNV